MATKDFFQGGDTVTPDYEDTAAAAPATSPSGETVTYQRVLNPLTVLYAAEGAALRGQASATGTALTAIKPTSPADDVDCYPGCVRPVGAGALPTDCNVHVIVTKAVNAVGEFVFTPVWVLVSNALNTAIAAIAANALECDLRFIQRKR